MLRIRHTYAPIAARTSVGFAPGLDPVFDLVLLPVLIVAGVVWLVR